MLNFLPTHTSSPVHQGNYKHETLLPGELALCLYKTNSKAFIVKHQLGRNNNISTFSSETDRHITTYLLGTTFILQHDHINHKENSL